MNRNPIFRSPFDVACFLVVVLVCLPLLAYMILDPAGFTAGIGEAVVELVDTVRHRLARYVSYYIVACVAFAVGFLFNAALHPRED